MAVVDSLRTLIKNTSGATKTFSFIPPHGKRLADDEETSVLGDIVLRLSSTRAREAYESGTLSDFNLALRQLAIQEWDMERVEEYYREQDALRKTA